MLTVPQSAFAGWEAKVKITARARLRTAMKVL
jgi:hypothetical protein